MRNFIVTALERLTRESFGDDAAAWAAYVENMLIQEQAQRLLAPSGNKEGTSR